LAERLYELGNPAALVGIDINTKKAMDNVSKIVDRGMIELILIDLHSIDASKSYKDGTFDLVFIDAMHDYESVKTDILAWLPKVKPGGILAGHDYMHAGEHAGVGRAVDEVVKPISPVTVEGTVWWTRIP
jgi:predicted O-methyltransferase YrrM